MTLVLNAIKIKQKDIDIYVTTIKASMLLKNCAIAWWTRDDPESGYQRPLKESRLNEIKSYLLKDVGTFPTSVLVNVRGDIKVKTLEKLGKDVELCEVTIPDKSLPLWIIDGQHRVKGLEAVIEENDEFEDYPIIVSIFNFHDTYDEMMQFHIVNSRAKSVPTDLAQRHILRMASKIGLPEVIMREGERGALGALAVTVVDKLIKDRKSPWFGKVQLPDEPRKQRDQVIKQRPLADSIHYILKEKRALGRDLDKLAELLKDYWIALAEIFPLAFNNPRDHTIQKTTGAYSLHMVLPDVLDKCEEAGRLDKDGMKQVLERMFKKAAERLETDINDNFWNKDPNVGHYLAQGTSMKMIKALAEYFREALWE